MKNSLIIIISFIITLSACKESIKKSKEDKIREIAELNGIAANSKIMFNKIMDVYSENLNDVEKEVYYKMLNLEIDTFISQTIDSVVPIYMKHFSEKEIDEILKFYKTPIGQKVISKTPEMISESMDIGRRLGGKMGENIYNKITNERKLKFDSIYYGCKEAKNGIFSYSFRGRDYRIERNGNKQIEKHGNTITEYEIIWFDDCRYSLKFIKSNNPEEEGFENMYNIVKCDSIGYEFISAYEESGFYGSGKLQKETK